MLLSRRLAPHSNEYTQQCYLKDKTPFESLHLNGGSPLGFHYASGATLSSMSPRSAPTACEVNVMPSAGESRWSQRPMLDERNHILPDPSMSTLFYSAPPQAFTAAAAESHSEASRHSFKPSKPSPLAKFSFIHNSEQLEKPLISQEGSQTQLPLVGANDAVPKNPPLSQTGSAPEFRFVFNNGFQPPGTRKSVANLLLNPPSDSIDHTTARNCPSQPARASISSLGIGTLAEARNLHRLDPSEWSINTPLRPLSPNGSRSWSAGGTPVTTSLKLALPLKHMTGAQNLLSWPAIRTLLPEQSSDLFLKGGPASEGIRNSDFMPRNDMGYFLRRDMSMIDRAERTFMNRIFILHPVLNPKELHAWVKEFKLTLMEALKKPSSKDTSNTKKRKRLSDKEAPESSMGLKARARKDRGFPAMNIPRTLKNAIVLLVIALGLICGRSSPILEVETIVNPRRQTEGSFPGFSHYNLADGIIGEFTGTVDLQYIQANILACLYRGQLTDVHGSHHHIWNAAWSCSNLLKSYVAPKSQIPCSTNQCVAQAGFQQRRTWLKEEKLHRHGILVHPPTRKVSETKRC